MGFGNEEKVAYKSSFSLKMGSSLDMGFKKRRVA